MGPGSYIWAADRTAPLQVAFHSARKESTTERPYALGVLSIMRYDIRELASASPCQSETRSGPVSSLKSFLETNAGQSDPEYSLDIPQPHSHLGNC